MKQKLWRKSIAVVLAAFVTICSVPSTIHADATPNHSLRLNAGTYGSSDYAWASFTLPSGVITGSAYTVSYRYKNAETGGDNALRNFTLWKAVDSSNAAVGPTYGMVQYGTRIRYNGGSYYTVGNLSQWHTVEYRVNGSSFTVAVDGQAVQECQSTFTAGAPATIWLGGLYAGTGGDGYFDDFTITQNGQTVYSENFENATVAGLENGDWHFSTGNGGSVSIYTEDLQLQSVALQASRSMYTSGETSPVSQILTVSGTLSDGSSAPLGGANITYTSDHSDIVAVTTLNGSQALAFKAPGSAVITASVTLQGVTQTASATLLVTNQTTTLGNKVLRIMAGTYGSSDYAWASFTVPSGVITGSAYTVSYRYKNAETGGDNALRNFTLWKAADSSNAAVGPAYGMVQYGTRIRYNGGLYYTVGNLSQWHTVEYSVNGSSFTVAVDGQEVQGCQSTFTAGAPATIWLGGLYAGTGGDGYFDDFTITQNGQAVYSETFESATVSGLESGDWHFSTGNGGSVSVDAETDVYQSIRLEILSDNIYQGDQVIAAVRGVLSGGDIRDLTSQAVVTASGATVSQDSNGLWLLDCQNAGDVAVTASYNSFSASQTVTVKSIAVAKTKSSYYTQDKVDTARSNAQQYQWAANEKTAALAKADAWLSKYTTYQALWSVIPSQDIPRTYSVNGNGCLVCGTGVTSNFGNYPYQWSSDSVDWKLTCPDCSVQFPTNDFAAYYQNGLNEVGEFDAQLAKAKNDELIAGGQRGNLVNLYSVNGVSDTMKAKIRTAMAAVMVNGARRYSDSDINATIYSMEHDPNWGVDDGMGYGYDPTNTSTYGNPYTFVGYYAHFAFWDGGTTIVTGMLHDLSYAYLLSGDQKYADAAIIMLDRLADVYPDMDLSVYPHNGVYGFPNSDGFQTTQTRGRILGSIWDSTLSKDILCDYDEVFPAIGTLSQNARDFLAQAAKNPNKGNPDRIKANFEDGLIREVAKAFKQGDLQGNPGMSQSTLALAAVVIDHYPETQTWLNWDFAAGQSGWSGSITPDERTGDILNLLSNEIDPDGLGDEVGLSYNSYWVTNWKTVADVLSGYQLPKDAQGNDHPLDLPTGTSCDLYQNPRFQKLLMAYYPLLLTADYTPNIGDTGQTGNSGHEIINLNALTSSYDTLTRLDTTGYSAGKYDQMAQAVYLLNGKTTVNLRTDIFTENPESVAAKVQSVINSKGQLNLGSQDDTAYGLGILRDGVDSSASTYRGTSYFFPNLQRAQSGTTLDNYSNLDQVNPNGTVGASITYTFSFNDSTQIDYQLYLKIHAVKDSWGTWDVYLNDSKIGTVDFAAYDSGPQLIQLLNAVRPLSGANTLRFVCTGGNGLCKMGLYNLYFLQTGLTMPPLSTSADTTERSLWMFYGDRSASHNHADPLNIGYIGYDLDLMPDFGYPNTTGGTSNNMYYFEKSNMAHNTVSFSTADGTYWAHYIGSGEVEHFDSNDYVKLINAKVSSLQNSGVNYASVFDRTTAMIRIDSENSYLVDLFRVQGADSSREYQYNFHTAESNLSNTVLTGLQQGNAVSPSGGYAADTLKNVYSYTKSGDSFSVNWNVLDTWNRYGNGSRAATNVHMKVTMLDAGAYNRVMLGEAVPPQNVSSNPDSVPILMVTGTGSTTFVSVIEAYQEQSNISSVVSLPVTENGQTADSTKVRAVKVTLTNGRVDYIVNSLDNSVTYRVDNKFDFCGFFGVYSEQNGSFLRSYLEDGTKIGNHTASAAVTGTVTGSTQVISGSNYIDINPSQAVDPSTLTGKYIDIDNSDIRASDPDNDTPLVYNAFYQILGATANQDGTIRLDVGDVSVIRGINSSTQAYLPNFSVGSAFRVQLGYTFTS